jgi:Zn-dependent metalloprotease
MGLLEKNITMALLCSPLLLISSSVQAQYARKTESEIRLIKTEKSQHVSRARDTLRAARKDFDLDDDSDFEEISSDVDEFGTAHVRFQQRYKNIKVWGGQMITHMDVDKVFRPHTRKLNPSPHVEMEARISPPNAILLAEHNLGGNYADLQTSAELVIFPITERGVADRFKFEKKINADMMEERLVANILAYHVQLGTADNISEPLSMNYIIDATTGDILSKWSSILHSHAVATGARSQYNGTVSINTNSTTTGTGYELRDMQRGLGGRFGNNLVLYSLGGNETIANIPTDATNTWGDGMNFLPGSTDDTRQTAAVDVAFGMAATWDFLKKVVNRNGVDGNGTAITAGVHDSIGANAAWWPTSMHARFGIGDSSAGIKNMNSLDLVAHEMGHGVTFAGSMLSTAEPTCVSCLSYESAQLNEGASDILGTMVEFYVRGGGLASGASVIPATAAGANWVLGDEVGKPRSLIDPVTWTPGQLYKTAHDGGQVLGHMFYLLAHGGSGVQAQGNDMAFRIFYRAWNYYFTANTDYVGARQAMITAARDISGNYSQQEQAVWNAFAAVNVGQAWTNPATCGLFEPGRQMISPTSIPSCNNGYHLRMRADGILEEITLQNPSVPIWTSGTGVNPKSYAVMQNDGNLVLYKYELAAPSAVLWSTGTWDYPNSYLRIANDSNLIIYTVTGLPIWSRVPLPLTAQATTGIGTNTSIETAQTIAPSVPGVRSTLKDQERHTIRWISHPGKC